MKIQWLGHACFKITHNGYSVVIDPYNADYTTGYPKLRTTADMMLISHGDYGHNCAEAVTLSGRPDSDCPFTISTLEVCHDRRGIVLGKNLIHILEADGLRIAHMGDIGEPLTGAHASILFGVDALLVTAGSCTGLSSKQVYDLCDELYPRVVIPMHYRDGKRGSHRLERVDDLIGQFESEAYARFYDTDTLELTADNEPQIAVLKYMG